MQKYLVLIILCICLSAGADILNVPEDYHYISLAIMAAADGDTVLVQPGNYSGIINYAGKAIMLTSIYLFTEDEADIYHTRLIGNYSDTSLINFSTGETETSILNGFTITNSGTPAQGGAVFCDGTSPVLSNLRFTGNQATSGGALFSNLAQPSLIKCEFANNNGSEFGGAVYLEESEIIIDNCHFHDNSCMGAGTIGRGGTIFVSNSSITCTESKFINNTASYHAGAIYLSYSSADIQGCQFAGNVTQDGNVGAIYFYNSDHLNVINCTFYNNTGNDAGALRFFHNVAGVDVPVLLNSICWGNTPSQLTFSADDLENEIIIAYSDLEGGQDEIVTNNNVNITWLDGNIDEDPLFIEPEYDFLALQAESSCIDSGIDYFEHESIVYLDLAENEYIGAAPDLGAIETDPDNLPILALFSSDITSGQAPLTVQFQDMSIGEVDEWQWDFDNDGEIDSDDQHPQWIYTEEGTYSVKLTVTAGTQTDYHLIMDMVEVEPGEDANENEILTSNQIKSIYPNPFNPETTIQYEIAQAGDVVINIYNIKGQLIKSIDQKDQVPGKHNLIWKATEHPAGMYLIKMKSDKSIDYQKAVLLK